MQQAELPGRSTLKRSAGAKGEKEAAQALGHGVDGFSKLGICQSRGRPQHCSRYLVGAKHTAARRFAPQYSTLAQLLSFPFGFEERRHALLTSLLL